MRDIVALDDPTLSARRRARIIARFAADPEAQRLLAGQRRVRTALEELQVRAPDSLRRRVEQLHTKAERRPFRLAITPPGAGPALAACATIALVVVLSLTLAGPLTAIEVGSAVIHRQSLEAAPREGSNPAVLARSFAGVGFPNWSAKLGWKQEGARRIEVDGRATDTVYYTREGNRIAYTVVDGEPLEPPSDARRVQVGQTTVHVYHDNAGHTMVTFERNGRTCVLSGHGREASTLIELAAWRGDGALSF
jgi:hypothetical protein